MACGLWTRATAFWGTVSLPWSWVSQHQPQAELPTWHLMVTGKLCDIAYLCNITVQDLRFSQRYSWRFQSSVILMSCWLRLASSFLSCTVCRIHGEMSQVAEQHYRKTEPFQIGDKLLNRYLESLFKDYFSLSVGMPCESYDFKLLDFFTASFVTGLFLNPLSQEKKFYLSVLTVTKTV